MDAESLADKVESIGGDAIRLGTLIFIGRPTRTSVEFRFDRDPGDNWARHLYNSLVHFGVLTGAEFATQLLISSPVQEGSQWIIRVDIV